MKRCSKCRVEKPLENFHRCSTANDGIYKYCRDCTRANRKAYHAKFGEQTNQRRRQWYRENTDYACAHQKAYVRAGPRQSLACILWRVLKRRPTENPVTGDQLMKMFGDQGGRCAVSGITMTWLRGKRRKQATSVTIDRIDQSRGYEPDNVQLVCSCVVALRGATRCDEMMPFVAAFFEKECPNQQRADVAPG